MIAAISFVVLLIGVVMTALGHIKVGNASTRLRGRKMMLTGVILSVLAVAGIGVGLHRETTAGANTVYDYDSCAAAGNPVQESYPPVCRTSSGQSFTQTITKVQKCPDKWVENKTPAGTDTITQQYFMFGNQRTDTDQVDIEWVVKNCKVKAPTAAN